MFQNLSNYKFVTREIDDTEIYRGRTINKKTVIIGIQDSVTNIVYPHPITHFIQSIFEYSGRSINSQSAPAQVVCRFLNFILENIHNGNSEFKDLRSTGIRGLNLLHGSRYITHLTLEGKQKTTIKQYEKYINRFYIYLKEMNLIDESFDIIKIKSKLTKNDSYKSIFRHPSLPTRYPSKETIKLKPAKLKDFGDRRRELSILFIQTSREIAPEIALGLCLQFYGGLRRGEIVNITRGDLNIKYRESFEVQIRDNRQLLFPHLSDTANENPKRLNYLNLPMCRQTILDDDLVWDVYDDHIKTLDISVNKKKVKYPQALFIDSFGNPMSGKVYEKRFKKVKKVFLDKLFGTQEHYLFDNTSWGTHIGRGVFTNILINMGFTVTKLAIARGDRNINTAMKYIDETLAGQQIQEAVNEFKNVPLENLGKIDLDDVKKLWQRREEK